MMLRSLLLCRHHCHILAMNSVRIKLWDACLSRTVAKDGEDVYASWIHLDLRIVRMQRCKATWCDLHNIMTQRGSARPNSYGRDGGRRRRRTCMKPEEQPWRDNGTQRVIVCRGLMRLARAEMRSTTCADWQHAGVRCPQRCIAHDLRQGMRRCGVYLQRDSNAPTQIPFGMSEMGAFEGRNSAANLGGIYTQRTAACSQLLEYNEGMSRPGLHTETLRVLRHVRIDVLLNSRILGSGAKWRRAQDAGPGLCFLLHLILALSSAIFPPLPPHARQRHLNVDLRKSLVFGTHILRCQSITWERDYGIDDPDCVGTEILADAGSRTRLVRKIQGAGRCHTDVAHADREESRLMRIVCPRSRCAGGTRTHERHTDVRAPPESTEAMLSAGTSVGEAQCTGTHATRPAPPTRPVQRRCRLREQRICGAGAFASRIDHRHVGVRVEGLRTPASRCGVEHMRAWRGAVVRARFVGVCSGARMRVHSDTSRRCGSALNVGHGGVNENAQQSPRRAGLAVWRVSWWAVVRGSGMPRSDALRAAVIIRVREVLWMHRVFVSNLPSGHSRAWTLQDVSLIFAGKMNVRTLDLIFRVLAQTSAETMHQSAAVKSNTKELDKVYTPIYINPTTNNSNAVLPTRTLVGLRFGTRPPQET
ncbi:hypothetical protein C8R44DRAFT_751463 [Mycena epipterygia]|nr:hypothetical protein C8R44DRAFT_751463 [Mycena epipterygia]